MFVPRGADGVDRDLNVAVSSVFDADRHRQPGRQFAVNLALHGAGADRAPTDEVGIELPEGGVEKLRADGQSFGGEVGE